MSANQSTDEYCEKEEKTQLEGEIALGSPEGPRILPPMVP